MSRALVISGGGAKGSYAVGVAQVLMEEKGLAFDVVSGTSTGGLIAPFVASNRLDLARDFYTTVHTEDIFTFRSTSELLKAPSLASFAPLINKARSVVAEIGIKTLLGSATRMFLAATRLQDRNAVYFHNGAPPQADNLIFKRITNDDTLVRAMVASASVPGIAPPVDIGDFQYVDGGVREMTPLSVPVAMGIEEIFVILLSPQSSPLATTRYGSIPTILGRTADSLTTDVARSDLDPIARARELAQFFKKASRDLSKASGLSQTQVEDILNAASPQLGTLARTRFVVIGPAEELTKNSMDFNPTAMKRMMEQGATDARAVLDGA